ncbi:MAG: FtsW/RodA/SpoVE family cell cycle protein [Actinomycetota bacterium]
MQSPATRRNSELSLLLIASILASGALVPVAIARRPNSFDLGDPAPYMVGLSVAYLVAHVFLRKLTAFADSLILPLAALLNGLGLAGIYRLEGTRTDIPEGIAGTQIMWAVLGLGLFIATLVLVRDYKTLASYKYVLGFVGVGLLLLPMTPLGKTVNGARLWIGFGSFQFQPGELAKICLVIFFAAYLADRKELLAIASRKIGNLHIPDFKHFGPLLVMWGLSLSVMFFEKDLGSSLLFFSIFLVMIYIATARFVYMSIGLALFGVGAYLGYTSFSHVQLRVTTWLNALDSRYVTDESYQLAQSLFAFATGGLFGTGFSQGRPDLIPAAHTDFIFSVIGEELGLLGTSAIVLAFMLLIARGLRIAFNARDDFGQLLAAGLTAILGLQTIIILGGVTRLLPLTGITLPFMSYGGSSMLANFVLLALLVRISHQTVAEPAPAETSEILIGGRG